VTFYSGHYAYEAYTSMSVFFNLFAAAGPSANVCVAYGTLSNDPSVYPTFCNKPVKLWYCYNPIELWLRISFQAIFVESLAATQALQNPG